MLRNTLVKFVMLPSRSPRVVPHSLHSVASILGGTLLQNYCKNESEPDVVKLHDNTPRLGNFEHSTALWNGFAKLGRAIAIADVSNARDDIIQILKEKCRASGCSRGSTGVFSDNSAIGSGVVTCTIADINIEVDLFSAHGMQQCCPRDEDNKEKKTRIILADYIVAYISVRSSAISICHG